MADYTKYNLYYNGEPEPLGKNLCKSTSMPNKPAVVNTAIKHYIERHPDKTYEQLQKIFNKSEIYTIKSLILNLHDYESEIAKSKNPEREKNRYGEISVNGTTYYICCQFGHNTLNDFQDFVEFIKQYGYAVEEAGQSTH